MNKSSYTLKGRIRLGILEKGVHRFITDWQNNLLLDQGMNNLSTVYYAQLFAYAVKGTGNTPTRETVDTSNNYTLVGSTLSRNAAPAVPRNFTSNDVGKMMVFSPSGRLMITAFNSSISVDTRPVGQDNFGASIVGALATFYNVEQTELDAEVDRTNTYLEGSTTDTTTGGSAGTRVLSRTFAFDPEPENKETVDPSNSYTWTLGTDLVNRVAGTRDFTSADEGKYIQFVATGAYAKIIQFNSATQVQVDSNAAATETAQDIYLYGFNEYGEIGFSDQAASGANLNVRVRLETSGGVYSPVLVLGENPSGEGQQLTVTYEFTITLEPNTAEDGSAPVQDPTNAMSGNKSGVFVIEDMTATSYINTDGTSNIGNLSLEPAYAGFMGYSPSTDDVVPITGVVRNIGVFYGAIEKSAYTADSFIQVSLGIFQLSQAIGTAWRCLGIYEPATGKFPFMFNFAVNQTKDATHRLLVSFTKTWDRVLPYVAP